MAFGGMSFCTWRGVRVAVVAGITAFAGVLAFYPQAQAVPASKPRITVVPGGPGEECREIATGAVDHGEDNAQKFADELLEGDIKDFKRANRVPFVKIKSRFRKCKYHLWFLGDEYNCTSAAVICWKKK